MKLRELLANPFVRIACGVLGAGILAAVVWAAGARAVLTGLGASIHAMPAVVALEVGLAVCNTLALRALYGKDAARVSARLWLKAGAAGYAVGAVLPIGRASTEAARAVVLRNCVGGPRAAVAAVQMQGVALMANGFLAAVACAVGLASLGMGTVSALLLGNAVVTVGLGVGLLILRQRGRPGRLLGAVSKRGRNFGAEFDAASGAPTRNLLQSLAWESGARCFQVFQCAVALAAFDLPSGFVRTLVTRGMLTVGSGLGDFIPAQLGATEATLVLGAAQLGLTSASAAALALLVHGAQLLLALLCTAVFFAVPGEAHTVGDVAKVNP